jgi:hypothetical protein
VEEQQEVERPLTHWQRKQAKIISRIQYNAMNPRAPNKNKKEITFQQALSILLRSKQLIREGAYHSHSISSQTKDYQINECYRQRATERE